MINLSEQSMVLLKNCLKIYKPSLIPLIEDIYNDYYSAELYNELRDIVGEELILKGFNNNYEPTKYGLKLESLIDEIGKLFL